MSTYDDGEAFANDDPADLVYVVHRERFVDDLVEQLHGLLPDFDATHLARLAARLGRTMRPDDGVVVDKRVAHAAIAALLASYSHEQRRVIAHETLVLAQQHTDSSLGRLS